MLDHAARAGARDINKADFFATINSVRREAFTYGTIRSGWRKTGLHPWTPETVLRRIRAQEAANKDPVTPKGSPARRYSQFGPRDTPTFRSSELDESDGSAVMLDAEPLGKFDFVRGNLLWQSLSTHPKTPPRQALPGPGEDGWKTPLTVRTLDCQNMRLIGTAKVLLSAPIAADIKRHLRGSAVIAKTAEGYKHNLLSIKVAKNA